MSYSYATSCSVPAQESWADVSVKEGSEQASPLILPATPRHRASSSHVGVGGDTDDSREPGSLGGEEADEGSAKEFRVLKVSAFRLEPDALPKSELTGLYFNRHRPCWSVDYYSRQRKRKTIDFFVPDVKHSTLALVLKCASACRLVLPRRFEDVPSWIPEPDESTGGLPYRAGAAFVNSAVLKWVLLNRLRGDALHSSSEPKRLHPRAYREAQSPVHGGGSGYPSGAEEFLYLPERLVSSDQQKQPHLLQQPPPIYGYSGPQQSPPSSFYYDGGSPAPSTHLQIDGREGMLPQGPCQEASLAGTRSPGLPMVKPEYPNQADSDGKKEVPFKGLAEVSPQASPATGASPASFKESLPVNGNRCPALIGSVYRGKRPLERGHKEVRCIRRPAVLPIPVPRLDERLLTASEKLEPSGGSGDLLWAGRVGRDPFVTLPFQSAHGSCFTPGDVSCWGHPSDVLRAWYGAAEGDGDDYSGLDAALLECSSPNAGGALLPFRVTAEDMAAAAELASRPYTPTDLSG
ncbi:hypothetical protein ACSSS7_002902 [Eimeria intestinalis]